MTLRAGYKPHVLICVYDMEIGGIERSLLNLLEAIDYEQFTIDLHVFCHTGLWLRHLPPQVRLLPEIPQYAALRGSIANCLRRGQWRIGAVRLAARFGSALYGSFRRLPAPEGHAYVQMQLLSRLAARCLPQLAGSYDSLISYAWPHDIAAACVAAKQKIAWIHTDYSKLTVSKRLDLANWRRFDRIVSISDACSSTFSQAYPELSIPIERIDNLLSPAMIKRLAQQSLTADVLWQKGNCRLVTAGRLAYSKGLDVAVHALRLLHDRGYSQLSWYVVGSGGYEQELRQLIALYGLEQHFILLGEKENPYPYMQQCDLYVQPSRYEGKAMAVLEAQLLGKPVLITSYPTSASQISSGVDGYICDQGALPLANAIERLIRSEQERDLLGKQAALMTARLCDKSQLQSLYRMISPAKSEESKDTEYEV